MAEFMQICLAILLVVLLGYLAMEIVNAM